MGVVNNDCKAATIEFDQKCIKKGGDSFMSYHDDDGGIAYYNLSLFKEDHELYNKNLGRANKKINDMKDEE